MSIERPVIKSALMRSKIRQIRKKGGKPVGLGKQNIFFTLKISKHVSLVGVFAVNWTEKKHLMYWKNLHTVIMEEENYFFLSFNQVILSNPHYFI